MRCNISTAFFVPTPDATGRVRVSGRVTVRAAKTTVTEVVISLRDRTPKDVRPAVATGRPLANGIQRVTLRRSETAASAVTNPKGGFF